MVKWQGKETAFAPQAVLVAGAAALFSHEDCQAWLQGKVSQDLLLQSEGTVLVQAQARYMCHDSLRLAAEVAGIAFLPLFKTSTHSVSPVRRDEASSEAG